MGAVWLVRRAAIDEVGPADDAFFLFSEETDWAYRFRAGGLEAPLLPGRGRDARVRARRTRAGSSSRTCAASCASCASTAATRYAERARRLLLAALRLRGALLRGERGRMYREGAGWLASGRVGDLLG